MADNNTRIIISAEDKASAALSSIAKNVGGLQTALGGLGATLGATLTVGGFTALIKSTIDAADQMNDLSQKVGIAVKDLGTWKLAAESSGTSMEAVAKGVKGLSAYMHDHSKELKAAGITATDAGGAMTQLADIFKAMPDGVEKTALAVKIFGKAGMDMIPMLNIGSDGLKDMAEQSAEYGRRLAILAPQADKFNDELAKLSLNSKAAGINIATYLIGPLTNMVTAFADVAAGGERLWAVMQKIGDSGNPLFKALLAWRSVVSPEAGRTGNGWAMAGMDPATGKAQGGGMMLPGGNSPAELDALRKAGILNPVAAAAAARAKGNGIIGPDDVLYNIQEAVRKQSRAAIEASDKEADAFAARAKAMDELHEARIEAYRIETEGEEAVREAMEKTNAAMAQEAWKASQNAAKKAAEDAARSWENFTRDLESSLTDALMRSFEAGDNFGQAFADNLKNLFKTMILKAAVQISVGTVAGAASQVLGINLGGSGGSSGGVGGALNMLSNGSSIYSAATGGGLLGGFGMGAASAASELALGAAFVGPSASLAGGAIGAGASAGLATGSAGAAGAMSSIAAAAPYVAAALAVASIFGGFGKNTPAPIEWGLTDLPKNDSIDYTKGLGVFQQYAEQGPFGTTVAVGQHLTRNGMNRAALQAQVTHPLVQLDNVLGGYLSETEKRKISRALVAGNEGEHGWSEAERDGVMMRRLNRISNALGGWIDKAFDTTSGNLQKRYQELAQILSIRGNEVVEKLAKDMLNATGKWSYEKFANLQTKIAAFNDSFKTDADRFKDYSDAMHKAFEKMNLVMPDSREAFKKMVEAVDTSTKSGFELYVTLLDLAPTMDAYYQALKDEAAIKGQLAAMNEDHFATAVDFQRYKAVSANFDGQFAGDYAYNIKRGAITPGAAANGDLVSEIRALRAEIQAGNVAIAVNTQETAKTLRRWNGDGMPDVRVVA